MTNAYIQQQRKQFENELLKQPNRDEVAAMLVSEDESNPVPVLESLLNRTLYLKAHGINRTLHKMLFSGFYGPINRGRLPHFIAELHSDARLRQKMYDAINNVLAGSDIIRGHTDQGLPSDPGGKYEIAHSHVMIGGEVFGDWGGGPESYAGAAAWRQNFEGKAYVSAAADEPVLNVAGHPLPS
jgi:hypothetical protein